jgi:hypothetical protein
MASYCICSALVDRAVAFEPPYVPDGSRPHPGAHLAHRLRTLVAAQRRDDAVTLFQTEAIGLPKETASATR